MKDRPPVGVAVAGLGFMGRTHVAAYLAASEAGWPNRLVAVCDPDPERRAGRAVTAGNLASGGEREHLFDPREVAGYGRFDELLADGGVELVSICTPTDTHVELALAALAAGKHVLVEKPVAVSSAEVRRLAEAAARSGALCMPAMCIRFWPAYAWLASALREARYGAVRSATFTRLAAAPSWSPEFYRDPARTGGALVDLHAHDADFVLACFGAPRAVASAGTLDHVTTLYHYDRSDGGGHGGPPHVVAEGGWDLAPGCAFRMRYTVVCEGATLDFELGRSPELLLARGASCEPVELDPATGYELEIRHFLGCIAAGTQPAVTLADSELLARLLEAERASLESGLPVELR